MVCFTNDLLLLLRLFLRRSFWRLLRRPRSPVVQVVGDLVALAADGELCHDAGRMGNTVAVLALGHHLMFFLMAERALECPVLGLAGGKHIVNRPVARGAKLRRRIRRIGNGLRHMRLMACFAIGGGHFRRVRLVALGTLGFLAVDIMTEGTTLGAMLALVLLQLSNLLRMAGKTGVRYIVRKRDLQGCMGVPVAAKTPLEFEVRLPHVAVAALRNG